MFDPVGVTGYTVDVVAFCAAWCVLAAALGFGYTRVCRWSDRRAAEERELRECLAAIGREERLLGMIENVEELVRDVRFSGQTARLAEVVRRAPLVAVEDIDRMAG